MTAQLIFKSDDDKAVTYFLDRLPEMPERDARIARALMEMSIAHLTTSDKGVES